MKDWINTIQLGDCYKLIKEIPDNSIDLVVTDPPYLLETDGAGMFGKKADMYGGERFVMKNIDFMKNGINNEILDEMCRVLKKINIYIWCSQKQIPLYYDYFVKKKKCNWNIICWHKTNPTPTCSNKYLTDTEYCLFFREKGVKIYGTMKTKFTYYVSKLNTRDKKIWHHPTIKPLEIIKNLIINSTVRGGVVLDTFCGSGTTCVAAKELDREFIGIEIDPKYHKTAINRLNGINEEGQLSIFTDIEKIKENQ